MMVRDSADISCGGSLISLRIRSRSHITCLCKNFLNARVPFPNLSNPNTLPIAIQSKILASTRKPRVGDVDLAWGRFTHAFSSPVE
jgi:hypothetical protein